MTHDNEFYYIKKDTFELNTSQTFRQSLKENRFTDVILVTDDNRKVEAHKVIISSCSRFFSDTLDQLPYPNLCLYLKGIKFKELQNIIKFIYTGECKVEYSKVNELLEAGKDLFIEGLTDFTLEEYPENPKHVYPFKKEIYDDKDSNTNEFEQEESNFVKTVEPIDPINIMEEPLTEKSKRLKCSQCPYKASFGTNLRRHVKGKHSGVTFKCDQCEQIFIYPSDLKKHKNSSTKTLYIIVISVVLNLHGRIM